MKKNIQPFIIMTFALFFINCSSDDTTDEISNISPADFTQGNWISSSSIPQLDGTIKYKFFQNNLIEEGVFETNDGESFTVDYRVLFSGDEFIIEEEITDNSYTLCLSYSSGEIAFFEDTNFRIPICRRFDLVSENLISAPYPHTGLGLVKQ